MSSVQLSICLKYSFISKFVPYADSSTNYNRMFQCFISFCSFCFCFFFFINSFLRRVLKLFYFCFSSTIHPQMRLMIICTRKLAIVLVVVVAFFFFWIVCISGVCCVFQLIILSLLQLLNLLVFLLSLLLLLLDVAIQRISN